MPHTRAGLQILVVAPGRDPAAVLERALSRLSTEQRMPHEIHVVAPRRRLQQVQRDCLGERFARACGEAGFPRDEVLFNQRTLHAVDGHDPEDCAADADRIIQILKQFSATEGATTIVVAEDAGTVAHAVHAAMQIVGRVSDRLLVDCGDPARSRGGSNESSNGGVHVEVPIVLWPANEPAPESYSEAVRRRQIERLRVMRPDVMRLDVRRRMVSVDDVSFTLPAMQFFWLWYLASAPGERFPLAELTALTGSGRKQPAPFTQKLSDGKTRVLPADLQRAFTQMFPMAADKFEGMYQRACGLHPGLPSTISKINAAFRRALGRGAAPYLIQGGRGAGGYRLTLPASAIQIVR